MSGLPDAGPMASAHARERMSARGVGHHSGCDKNDSGAPKSGEAALKSAVVAWADTGRGAESRRRPRNTKPAVYTAIYNKSVFRSHWPPGELCHTKRSEATY